MGEANLKSGAVARVFIQQPERVAAAWRQLRGSYIRKTNGGMNLLDEVVESFVRELGKTLSGVPGRTWSRTSGVLRLSQVRGTRGLHEEFSQLRQCVAAALEALKDSEARNLALREVDEAADSAVALMQGLEDGVEVQPGVPFGGLVVELFEHAPEPRAYTSRAEQHPMH